MVKKLWRKRVKDDQGFTILELLAVFAILAIIIAIAVPRYSAIVAASKTEACAANIEMISKAAAMYYEIEDTRPDIAGLVAAGYIEEQVNCPFSDLAAPVGYSIDATSGTVTCLNVHP